MDQPPLHEAVERVAFLLGTWVGEGQGSYPTIEPFAWRDTTRFWHVGKPALLYEQRTKDAVTGEPKHAESGFLRAGSSPGQFELIVAHNTGHAELAVGTAEDDRIELASTMVHGTDTAKDVSALQRVLHIEGDALIVTLSMAAVGEPMTHHLRSELHRQD